MKHPIASRSRAVSIGALVCCLASCRAARTPEVGYVDQGVVALADATSSNVAPHGAASFEGRSFGASHAPFEPHSTAPTALSLESFALAAEPLVAAPGARSGTYLQLGFGLVTTRSSSGPSQDVEFDQGYAVPVAIGWRLPGADDALALDLEVEGIYTDQDVDDDGLTQAVVDITQFGLLFNALADFEVGDALALYAGGGIGLSFLDIGTTSDGLNSFEDEDGPFLAWQLKGGLRWWMSDALSWNLGYRFLNVDDVEIDDGVGSSSFDLETEQHVIEIGIRLQL
jgi:opacity protein-like surface antigen